MCISKDKKSLSDNVNHSDLIGITPLLLATKLNNRESVIVCCENNADPNLRSVPYLYTPLEIAI